ncbi:hypothetical protein C5167_016372 [Papaver somniferum]|nr:hypothetical protein C5167_016372 [Papaver somniferum]
MNLQRRWKQYWRNVWTIAKKPKLEDNLNNIGFFTILILHVIAVIADTNSMFEHKLKTLLVPLQHQHGSTPSAPVPLWHGQSTSYQYKKQTSNSCNIIIIIMAIRVGEDPEPRIQLPT